MTKTSLRVIPGLEGGSNLCTKPISLLMQDREYVNSNMALCKSVLPFTMSHNDHSQVGKMFAQMLVKVCKPFQISQ